MTKGKRIKLPVSNEELKKEYNTGVSVSDLALKYKCSSSVIYRRLLEKDRYKVLDTKNITGYEIVSINEAMKITGLSRFIITQHMKSGAIPCTRIGNRYMFQLRDIYQMVGIDITEKDNDTITEMDILKDNQQKSSIIENIVSDLVIEMKKLKKSVTNENKEVYDKNVMNALQIINESQNKINDTILKINNEQNEIKKDLKTLHKDIDTINNTSKINTVVKPIKQNNPLDKFGGN